MNRKDEFKEPDESIFRDPEKEAEFWETHFDEAWKQGTPVQVKFAKNLSEPRSIRLDIETWAEIRKKAAKKGLKPGQYARMLILEHLHDDEK
jgi:predicted DNA binding CopG/RHH family protein